MKKVLALVLVLGLASAAPAVNLAPNPDFEGGTYTHWTGAVMANGWDAYWNQLEGWGAPSAAYADSSGGNTYVVADVDGTQGGGYAVIFTGSTIPVPGGTPVNLSADIIDLVPNGGGGGAILKVESWAGGSVVDALEVPISGVGSSWANFDIDYTVAASADSVKAVLGTSTGWAAPNASPSSYGFDNVVLTPEPMTMTLLGLGGLSLIRRRRK